MGLNLEVWVQQIVNGVSIGALYAMIAVGYSMVYGVLQMINFAHGEIFMIGGFAGYLTIATLDHTPVGQASRLAVIALALLAGMIASPLAAIAVERVAYRPLRHAPRLAPLISAIGVSIFLQNLVLRLDGGRPRFYASIFPRGGPVVGDVHIAWSQMLIIGGAVLSMLGLQIFLRRTRRGRAIRAVAEDQQVAALMGINVDAAIVTTFAVGAVLAGLAGVMWGLQFNQVDHYMGFLPGIKAFTAAVLGGIGNVAGAMLGGFFLGLTETLAVQALPHGFANYEDVVALGLLIAFLVLRPGGILGEHLAKRA
jgi:branched-chain amino acid transport system permease protein